MLELLVRGGFTMIFLFVCSIVALTIIIERFFVLRKDHIVPQKLSRLIERGASENEIVQETKTDQSILASMIKALAESNSRRRLFLTNIFDSFFKRELNFLQRGLETLQTIAAISPLLGLLGTVIGMVEVFAVIAKMGMGQASALSGGISKALITTVVGLIIAIPTLVFYNFFSKRVENFAIQLEDHSQAFISKISIDNV